MTDVLIRDVPDDVIAALDAHAGGWDCLGANTCAVAWLRTPPRQAPRSVWKIWPGLATPSVTWLTQT